ncbi:MULTISPECIES: TraR/DksA family transcriptional regulator [Kordiimonas]|jgi:DnaK suppressor protein|uniref:TraR/DksA family transcriptional regulator n=1 Tax=Kordiimonas TaxID=288021 RepID=UPI002579E204|nr:TraR/DksA family transcriptional regulator [Kordiimonas sp. UBA4487]
MAKNEKKSSYWSGKLLRLRQELENLDKEALEGRQAVELDQSRVGRLSRMDALQGQAMNNAIAERRRATLARIEAALARLEEDEFGYCTLCGEEIAEKRLELDPTVCTCTACIK